MRGRKKGYQIELTTEEREELERWQRTTTMPAGKVQRARAMLLLAEGLPVKEVMVRVGLTGRIIRKWVYRFLEKRVQGLDDLPRAGRKRAFPP